MLDEKILAHNIKKYRKRKGLTQDELAQRLYMTPQNISKWECGISIPDVEKLCALADVFGISVDRLIGCFSKYDKKTMIAVDGGGTKTEFVLFTEQGELLSHLVLPGCNPNSYGMEKTFEILSKGIDSMMEHNTNIIGLYVGAAGVSSGDNRKKILKFLKNRYRTIKIDVQTDILNVIYSMGEQQSCIAAICGTGSIVYAKCNDEFYRVGGWGYLLDQAGSGYDIGRDVLRAALEWNDGMRKRTILTDLAEQKLGGNAWDKIDLIYSLGVDFIASFAPVAFEACRQGDATAKRIISENTKRLAYLITQAEQRYHCEKKVIVSGGIACGNPEFQENLLEQLGGEFEVLFATEPQVCGAAFACVKMLEAGKETFLSTFKKNYNKYLEEVNAENGNEK